MSSSEDEGAGPAIDPEVDAEIGQAFDVEFESFQAAEVDFHNIKVLLKQLFRMNPVDMSDVADMIIGQSHVGCVIKQVGPDTSGTAGDPAEETDEVDDTVYGVSTVLNLKAADKNGKPRPGPKSFLDWVSKKINTEAKAKLTTLLKKYDVGWIVNERFVNLPVQISGPVYSTLQSDMKDARDAGEPFRFDYYLYLSKLTEAPAAAAAASGKGKGRKKNKRRRTEVDLAPAREYSNPEDELLEPMMDWHETFVGAGDLETQNNGPKPLRSLMCIKATKFDEFVTELSKRLA